MSNKVTLIVRWCVGNSMHTRGLLNIESAIYGMQKIVYFYPKNEENSQLFDEFLDKKDVVLCFSFVCSQYSTVPQGLSANRFINKVLEQVTSIWRPLH